MTLTTPSLLAPHYVIQRKGFTVRPSSPLQYDWVTLSGIAQNFALLTPSGIWTVLSSNVTNRTPILVKGRSLNK
jgi:hypothetical protein